MKLRSERKNSIILSPILVFEILKYINPLLHYLVSRHYFFGAINNIDYDRKLPISLLLSLNNLEVLESFKTVLLSYNFGYSFGNSFMLKYIEYANIKNCT